MPTPVLSDYVFATSWPDPRKRWTGEVHKIGVYAIVHENYAYVGMTVSCNGFKARWAKHHRNLFVKKRRISQPKLKKLIKDKQLSKDAFTLYALQVWDFSDAMPKSLVDEIARVEQEQYDALEALGFTMVNTVRPTGAGYSTVHVIQTEVGELVSTREANRVTMTLEGKDASGRAWKVTGSGATED